jgi:tRNA1Val (adenine37-N6)-methyltransferase
MDRPGETIDPLGLTNLRLIQPKKGYRFSIDPVLLCAFVPSIKNARVVDLGAGNGIIPLLLSARKEAHSITGVELQPAMVERARRSVKLNGLEGAVRFIPGDVRALPEGLFAGGYDVVTVNPPYRTQETGRIAPEDERAIARHELSGGLCDFLSAAFCLLKAGGHFYIVYLAERIVELLSEMRSCRLEPKRLRMVHSREGDAARMVLVEGRKAGKPGMVVEAPLIIYAGEGRDYSGEVLAMYEGNEAQGGKRKVKSL